MHLYLIAVNPEKTEAVDPFFTADNKVMVLPGVWLVRSELTSSVDVASQIGLSEEKVGQGIVVSAEFYSGYAAGSVLEQLRAWGER